KAFIFSIRFSPPSKVLSLTVTSGINEYSIAKSLAISTPKPFLGRSRTWPTLATTLKSEPKKLPIFEHLLGDSTITRFMGYFQILKFRKLKSPQRKDEYKKATI